MRLVSTNKLIIVNLEHEHYSYFRISDDRIVVSSENQLTKLEKFDTIIFVTGAGLISGHDF